MIFRNEVSSGASRPTETVVWICEIESSKSVDELRTSNTITAGRGACTLSVSGLQDSEWPQEDH